MTAARRRRIRRKQRFVRNVKRTIVNVLLMPARMPRITSSMLDRAMHTSEITGIVFAAVLMTHLFNPLLVSTGVVVIAAGCFIGCLMFIKFGDYQDQLEEMKYYGYNI